MALWDLKARLLNVPVVQLLGSMRDEVLAYGSGGFTSYSEQQLIDQMSGWAGEGLKAVKMKIGRQPEQDVSRAASVRKAVGDSVNLFVDANGAYSRKQALRKAQEFAELNVVWFEEPVTSDDRHGLNLLVHNAPPCINIAAGEYSYTLDDARLLAEAGAVDVMQADVTRCGGPTNFIKIADYCETAHLPLSAHTSPTVHATLCCALVPAINVEYFYDHVRIEGMFLDGAITARGGMLRPDVSRPGFGFEWKQADAEKFQLLSLDPLKD
jgi:L-alanine-DL-glutamate epimerase-like enolase superfamily enzyme